MQSLGLVVLITLLNFTIIILAIKMHLGSTVFPTWGMGDVGGVQPPVKNILIPPPHLEKFSPVDSSPTKFLFPPTKLITPTK